MASTEYHGKYKKLFPSTLSSNSVLSIYILHLLEHHKTMYGKEIADHIYSRLQGTWNPSHGLIYPMLRNMENEGLVEGSWEGASSKKTKRHYKITSEGKKALFNESQKAKTMFEQSQKMLNILMHDLYAAPI